MFAIPGLFDEKNQVGLVGNVRKVFRVDQSLKFLVFRTWYTAVTLPCFVIWDILVWKSWNTPSQKQ